MRAVGDLVSAALAAQPTLRFVSVAELALQYGQGGELLDPRLSVRLSALVHRLDRPGRRRKMAAMLVLLTVLAAILAVV